MKRIFLITALAVSSVSLSQEVNVGYSLGLSFSFGTAVNRIGVHSSAFINYGFAQVNGILNWHYNFKSLGLSQKTPEFQLGIGAQAGFGRKDTIVNRFIGITENNTFHDYALGFSYVRYWDKSGTTQSTGIVNAAIRNFNLITENDLFGNLIHQTDRYRTGAFMVEYQYMETKIGLTALLWTHDYAHCPVVINDNSKKWARFGYYEDKSVSERQQSLGLLSVQVKQWLPYNQVAVVNLGLNSERVRNAFQNEFIHDQPFFPDALVKRKPSHIPMLTPDGQQYLHLENQKVRKPAFYFNLGLNTLPFY